MYLMYTRYTGLAENGFLGLNLLIFVVVFVIIVVLRFFILINYTFNNFNSIYIYIIILHYVTNS